MSVNISIYNAKEGAAKTTTAFNLAVGLTKHHKKKVLLVDIDPQGHAGVACGVNLGEINNFIHSVLLKQINTMEAVIKTESGVDLVPASLKTAEVELTISGDST